MPYDCRCNDLARMLYARAKSSKGITFIKRSSSEEFISYHELYQAAVKGLWFLQSRGLKPKDELVFQLEDNRSFIITFWSCILGGIIPVPLSVGKNDDHKQKLFNVWPVLNNPFLVASNDIVPALREFAAAKGLSCGTMLDNFVDVEDVLSSAGEGQVFDAQENDIAFIQFSSGSTGSPKGVVLTHKNLITNIADISTAAEYSADDSTISWMPLTHDMGLIGFHLNPLFAGMHQYLIATPDFVRNPALWMDKASEHKVTVLCSPNFGYKFLLKHCDNAEYSWDLSHVRILYNGAEPVSTNLSREFLQTFSKYGLKSSSMCPVYGLAEASLAVSISGLQDEVIDIHVDRNALNFGNEVKVVDDESAVSFVNVGKAIDHCLLRIAGDNNVAVGEGVIGHIQIKGDNVTQGYYNNEIETNKVITADGWLNTGDLGFMKQGALYITGRAKDIIFVNGQNFYPHDIERVAEAVPGVELNKIAVAGFFNADTQKEETIAFVFHRGALESFVAVATDLKAHVNNAIGFELDRVLPVTNIPRTTSGKLQRFKLLEQYREGEFSGVEAQLQQLIKAAAPQVAELNEDERKLLNLCCNVLKTDSLNVDRSFFEQGGNSLKAAELAMAIAKAFGVELPVELIYERQSIRALAAEIKTFGQLQYMPIPQAPAAGHYHASPAQEQIYYAWKVDAGSVAYNIPVAFRINGSLNVEQLERATRLLINRYDSLRTCFSAGPAPIARVQDQLDFALACTAVAENDLDEVLRSMVKPFDLSVAPLFRIQLLQIAADEYILFTDFHHIISDGISVYNFVADLLNLYSGKELAPLTASYADYACWSRENKFTAQQDYWLNQLQGELPLLELPTDFKRPVLFNSAGRKIEFALDAATTARLKSLASANNVSLHVLMFTIYNLLLSKYSGQDDIITGIPVSGRRHPDLQGMFGMFVNNLAIRSSIDGNASFIKLLQAAKQNINDALANQDYPFGSLVYALAGRRDVSRNPVFDTMFIYQNMGFPQSTGISVARHFFDPGFSKYDLSLEIFDDTDSLKYYIEFCTALFAEKTIFRFQQHFTNLIDAVLSKPNAELAALELMNEQERNEQIYLFNATAASYPNNKTIHQLFVEQVQKTPCAAALEYNQTTLTYRELDDLSNDLASLLKARGVTRESIVAVLLERSPEMVIAILAILKAGGAYLPMDIGLPAERIASLVSTSKCQLIITRDEHLSVKGIAKLPPVEVLRMDFLAATSPGLNEVENINQPADLAYVLYTSGTTGLPKGVMIEHQSVVNYITWAAKNYINRKGAFPLFTSISFDLTVTSIFTPLLTGNKIVIYEEGVDIGRIISENKVDIIKLTPSHLKLLAEFKLPVKEFTFIVGGENLDTLLAQTIHDKFGGKASIFNEYGPTEATVGCMIYKFNPQDDHIHVPIGIPAANTQIYLLDKFLKPVPAGVTGELYISGNGLARGYLFNEELSKEKFIPNPFIPGKLMYKTGDMAKRTAQGQIIFIGRIDQQVKINGYRIELAEIENHLVSHPAIIEAVVVVKKGICAYYKGENIEAAALKSYLAERLPHYMLPVHFVRIAEVPLNKNGKRDLAALPEPLTAKHDGPLPKNRVEELSLEIWKQVLAEEHISTTDNFFELGGDSIKALQITSRLFEHGIVLNVKDILTYHTIEQISLHAKTAGTEDEQSQGICEGSKGRTPIESWFFAQQFENPNYYNQSVLLRLNKNIDLSLLEAAFETLIQHHDGLRLNYDPASQSMFYNTEHRTLSIPAYEGDLQEICTQIKSSFDITNGLLIKAAIINNELLFITAHHLIMDGISWRILLEDLYAAYTQVKLPRKTASLANWQKALFENPGLDAPEKETDYWKAAESTAFSIPQDFDTADWSVKNARNISGSVDEQTTQFLLKDAHRTYNTDVPILLNTALALTLREWTGLDEMVIEQENHGRHLQNTNAGRTIGWFTAMYPLRLQINEASASEQLKAVKEQMRRLPNHGIGYGIYKTMGLLETNWSRNLSPVRFNYLGQFDSEVNNELFSFLHNDTGSDSAPANHMTCMLELNCMVIGGAFRLNITYNQSAHNKESILQFRDKFFGHLHSILDLLQSEEEIQFTPSDFDAEELSSEDLQQLFG
jgi:amino acid adenylation domain-containing protein/non-ribosomal peptide synthase protein (TIGR01720 family)